MEREFRPKVRNKPKVILKSRQLATTSIGFAVKQLQFVEVVALTEIAFALEIYLVKLNACKTVHVDHLSNAVMVENVQQVQYA